MILDTLALAKLLEALNAPCGCELDAHFEDCRFPIDRWWIRWARDQRSECAA